MRSISFFQRKKIPPQKRARRVLNENLIKKKKRKIFLFFLFFLTLATALFYFLVFSPIFEITQIDFEIKDNNLIKFSQQKLKDEIIEIFQRKYLFFVPQNSFFTFPVSEVEKLLSQDKKISYFSVIKKIPNTLKIKIEIFKPKAIFSSFSHQNYFLINENGVTIGEVKEIFDVGDLPVIYEKIGQKIAEPAVVLTNILKFIEKINKNNDLKLTKVEITDPLALEVKFFTSENWFVYFDIRGDINQQIDNFYLILRERISNRQNLEYLDLRFGNRVFYK